MTINTRLCLKLIQRYKKGIRTEVEKEKLEIESEMSSKGIQTKFETDSKIVRN